MSRPFEGSYLGDGSKIGDDTRLECGICWWVYDPALGDDVTQVQPGTPFALLPDSWRCPNCDAEKSKFMVLGSVGGASPLAHPVVQLANAYRRAALSKKGLPIYNPTLAVEAIGFREVEGRHAGIVVTPWFMNLTVIPSQADLALWVVGGTVRTRFPSGQYDLLVSELPDFGLVATPWAIPHLSKIEPWIIYLKPVWRTQPSLEIAPKPATPLVQSSFDKRYLDWLERLQWSCGDGTSA